MPWSAEEMLLGQHQRVDISAYARTAHKGFMQKRLEKDDRSLLNCPSCPPDDKIGQKTELKLSVTLGNQHQVKYIVLSIFL